MSEALDETIKEIAVKHGVLIGKDDPILILHTMNERLLEESKRQQKELLVQFQEEVEKIASSWHNDAKEKAETILNHSLTSSKNFMAKASRDAANESLGAIKKTVSDAISECARLNQQAQSTSRFSLIACSCIITISSLFACFAFILR